MYISFLSLVAFAVLKHFLLVFKSHGKECSSQEIAARVHAFSNEVGCIVVFNFIMSQAHDMQDSRIWYQTRFQSNHT